MYGIDLESRPYSHGGMYILRHQSTYAMLVAHQVGVHGNGPHKHNDWLSIEICSGNQPIFIDPGTGCYTGNIDLRNKYRNTAAHNTVVIDNQDQIPLDGSIFSLSPSSGKTELIEWYNDDDETRVSAKHTGYMRFQDPVVHYREIRLTKKEHKVTIKDWFTGNGIHLLEWYFHLHPSITASKKDTDVLLTNREGHVYQFDFSNQLNQPEKIGGLCSYKYNTHINNHILKFKYNGTISAENNYIFNISLNK
jgi:uncharacterized heparinase superfamily protein